MEDDMLVSVVIPVKNGDAWLNETIPAILDQEIEGSIEIIAIDSGSTDKTLSILSKFPVRLIRIQPEDFNHGLTRNLGVQHAKGKFVVMTVQDAKPVSKKWLQELLNAFTDDTVKAVCGQQVVPHDTDKNPVEWFRPISKGMPRKYYFPNPENFTALPAAEQWTITRWDNVNAIYRKQALLDVPFRETDFAEDALWAKDALLAGYALLYNPLSQVAHYHLEDYNHVFNRNFIYLYQSHRHFGVVPEKGRSLPGLLRISRVLLREKGVSFPEKLKWLKYNYRNNLAMNRSKKLFLKTLSDKGADGLEVLYKNFSKSIPQALKSKSKN
jgi:rhamnosyltransferase